MTLPAYIVPQIEVTVIVEPGKDNANLFFLNLDS